MAQNEEDPLGILTGPYALSSMTPPDLSSCSKEDVLEYFENTYSLNESIFTILKSEDAFYKSPDRLRLPLIFYFGHTASVYINKLILSNLITERVNFQLETILETGVDEMNWDDTEHYRMGGSYKWPALSEVVEFRRQVRAVIRKVIENADFDLPIKMDSPLWALFMGFEHERIHLETSSVLIRQLPLEMVRVPVNWRRGPTENGKAGLNEMVSVCATDVQMGKPLDFPSYGWDNEYPEINISVPAFAASKYLITNAEFLVFVNDAGYRNESLWTTEGWQWRAFREAVHPTFWVCTNGCKSGCGGLLSSYSHCRVEVSQRDNNLSEESQTYRLRTVCELVVMPWTWPVEVNHHEARAYCRWKGKAVRLLTEGEHNAIRDLQLRRKDTSCDPVFRKELHQRSNLNLAFCTSTPVNHYPANTKGFHDVFGNVWQWMEDHFNGFPGMKTTFLYDDFSTECFDGKHNIILGGSWISTGDEASRFARYSFRRHFFQHAGFRIAQSKDINSRVPVRLVHRSQDVKYEFPFQAADILKSTNKQFEDDRPGNLLNELQSEYLPGVDRVYYLKLQEMIQQLIKQYNIPALRALDLNCACGCMTFQLCQFFSEVVGTDFCGSFVNTCQVLQEYGRRKTKSTSLGNGDDDELLSTVTGSNNNEEFQVEVSSDIDRRRALFKQLSWVSNELCDFDLVLVQSLHRVNNIKAWLARLWEVSKPGGLVLITSTQGLGRKQLQPLIGNRMRCVQTEQLKASYEEQEKTVMVTIWTRASS